MELREKTKYVLGLPGGTPKDYDHQPTDPSGQRFNGFFKASQKCFCFFAIVAIIHTQ